MRIAREDGSASSWGIVSNCRPIDNSPRMEASAVGSKGSCSVLCDMRKYAVEAFGRHKWSSRDEV